MKPALLTRAVALLILTAPTLHAQWELEESHTTADLRGIHSLGGGVAWASGTGGTVLRTEDGGYLWQGCATPPGAEKLDFRGIQAFDENTAIVMSSGPGDQSRLYKTTDGCRTWKLVFTNPEEKGFFDSLRRVTAKQLYLLGDPVDGKFAMFFSQDAGAAWVIADDPGLEAARGDGAFAASNSSLMVNGAFLLFGTGGALSPEVYRTTAKCSSPQTNASCAIVWEKASVPMAAGTAAAGVFSLAGRNVTSQTGKSQAYVVAVGGSHEKPDAADGTAATSKDGGITWTAAQHPPHGYRSAVAYDPTHQTWITVGPNGTDISHDDGRNWTALKPSGSEPKDADQHWNALSLPFVVGPHQRIGKLRADSLKP